MKIPWRPIGLGVTVAGTLGAVPAGYMLQQALAKRDDLLSRARTLKDDQIPTAAMAGTGAALLAGIATYNTMKQNAEKKGWVDPSKYSSYANRGLINKYAVGTLAKGLLGGAAAAVPIGAGGYYLADRYLADAKRRLKEGEEKLTFFENNLIPLSLGAGALLGGVGTAIMSRKKFRMPEPEPVDQGQNYYEYPMMR